MERINADTLCPALHGTAIGELCTKDIKFTV